MGVSIAFENGLPLRQCKYWPAILFQVKIGKREDAMCPDIEKALAYQVRKEIAQRYFRIRKLIEEDSENVTRMIEDLVRVYEDKLGPAMIRIYALLMDKDLIERFLKELGWEGLPFFDDHIVHSENIRKRLLQGMEPHGWFKSSKFTNLVMDSYRKLYEEYLEFDDLREDILDELAVVKEEIAQFTRNYSLDEIMSFLRNLNFEDESTVKALGKNIDSSKMGELEKKLAFPDISEIEDRMPNVPKLPKPDDIEGRLKALAHEAFERHRDEINEILQIG